ncbi:MAG TPA: META domain-containing protein [Levilinea sp.]|nr:META domain-containing protein [Levilinea sp.]
MKWLMLLMLLALAGCASQAATLDLEGTQWQLESIDGDPLVAGSMITLQFDAGGAAGGNSGCNSYGGGYSLEGSRITFDEIGSTLMACLEENIMEQEAAYLGALLSAQEVSLEGDRLTITSDGGALVFVKVLGE